MEPFEALLASGKTAVERWVRSRMSNSADAEDVLQETYLAAFQGFSALRNPGSRSAACTIPRSRPSW